MQEQVGNTVSKDMESKRFYKIRTFWGSWVSQLVKHQLLVSAQVIVSHFHEFEPHIGLCADSADPAWDSLCLPLSLSLPCLPKHPLSK